MGSFQSILEGPSLGWTDIWGLNGDPGLIYSDKTIFHRTFYEPLDPVVVVETDEVRGGEVPQIFRFLGGSSGGRPFPSPARFPSHYSLVRPCGDSILRVHPRE